MTWIIFKVIPLIVSFRTESRQREVSIIGYPLNTNNEAFWNFRRDKLIDGI